MPPRVSPGLFAGQTPFLVIAPCPGPRRKIRKTVISFSSRSRAAGLWAFGRQCFVAHIGTAVASPPSHHIKAWRAGRPRRLGSRLNHDAFGTRPAQRNENDVIFRGENLGQFPANSLQVGPIQPTTEDRKLDSLAVPLHVSRTFFEPSSIANVVTDEPPTEGIHRRKPKVIEDGT